MVTSPVRTSVGRSRGATWRALALAWIGLMAAGCGGDHLSPPPLADPDVLYWSVDFDHHAVTLSMVAPYDTATVTAIPHNHDAKVLAGLPAAQYTSSDPDRVLITSDGVLQAVAPTAQPVKITATLTAGNLKHTDEMLVRVVDGPPPPTLASFSIQPVPPDSAKIAAGQGDPGNGGKTLVLNTLVKATDVTGAALPEQLEPFMDSFVEVPDLLVWFGASDPTKVVLERIESSPLGAVRFRGSAPGKVTLYASTTAFGVTRVDTLPYRIGLPVWNILVCCGDGPYSAQFAREVAVGAGAAIQWVFGIDASDITDSLSVTFTDPTNVAAARDVSPSILELMGVPSLDVMCAFLSSLEGCGATGNIKLPGPKDFGGYVVGMRVFPVPGRYEYQEAVTGFRGTVVVVDER